MSIAEWPAQQRPREKLIQFGAQTLSDAELLAVFLRVGVPGQSAVELGNELLRQFGSLHKLISAPLDRFVAIRGLGPAKFASLQAGLEMTRRTLRENLGDGVKLENPDQVKAYLQLLIGSNQSESFVVLYLDVKLCLLGSEELFHGGLTHTKVYPREIVRQALRYNASAAILAHNHPSGVVNPSPNDIEMTQQLKDILASVEIRLLDHFIVGPTSCYSFIEHGLLGH